MVLQWWRALTVLLLLAVGLVFALSDLRAETHAALLPVFEWMETTPFGVAGKTWGALFAVVQAFHLLAMAVLGGAVLVSNAQLLGLGFRDTDFVELQSQCYRLLGWALFVVIGTGVFMACGVAVKVYYLDVFWYKMLALWVGCLFEYLLKRPLIGDAGAVAEQVLE